MLNLEDLVRESAEFKLSKSGDTVYKLNPCTLADEAWMAKSFGDDLEKIFRETRLVELSRIAFRLMDEESKLHFSSVTVTVIDEEGESQKRKMGGAELFRHFIIDTKDKLAVVEALLCTIGFSRPIQKELIDSVEKKSPEPLIGEQSSTSSATPMDGQTNTSSV